MTRIRDSDPTGLHRVLDAAGRPAPGRPAARHPPRARGPTRSGSASSGSTSTPRRSASSSEHSTAATATRSAPRCSTSSPTRGKMQNPVTGSGGMLVGTVEEVGPESPLGLAVGDRVATLVSLTLTPLRDHRRPRRLGRPRRAGARRRVRDPVRPLDRRGAPRRPRPALALAVMDVCGAPALTARVVGAVRRHADGRRHRRRRQVRLAEPGRGPRGRGRRAPSASSRTSARPTCSRDAGLADEVVARRRPRPGRAARRGRPRAGGPADVTVVCVDVPGCEGGAILATAERRHRHLLLDGHVVLRRRARRRGAGRRRHDAGRQRLRARPRGLRRSTCCAPSRASGRSSRAGSREAGMSAVTAHPLPQRRASPRRRRRPRATAIAVEDGRIAWLGDDDRRRGATPTAPTTSSTSTARWSRPASSTPTCTPCAPASPLTGLDLDRHASLARGARRGWPRTPRPRRRRRRWSATAGTRPAWPERRAADRAPSSTGRARPPRLPRPRRRALRGRLDRAARRRCPASATSTAATPTGASSATPTTPSATCSTSLSGPTTAPAAARAALQRDGRAGHRQRSTRSPPRTSAAEHELDDRCAQARRRGRPARGRLLGRARRASTPPASSACAGAGRRPVRGRRLRLAHRRARRAVRRPAGHLRARLPRRRPGRRPRRRLHRAPGSRPASTASATPRSTAIARRLRAPPRTCSAPRRSRAPGTGSSTSRCSTPAAIATLARLGVVASVQPVFDALLGRPRPACTPRGSGERAPAMNPFARPAPRAASALAFGSDSPGHAARPVGRASAPPCLPPRPGRAAHRRGPPSTRTPAAAGAPPRDDDAGAARARRPAPTSRSGTSDPVQTPDERVAAWST